MSKPKAIYSRKSRDESGGIEDVLAKHRAVCTRICEQNGWEYTLYEEVGSSDSLKDRPQMMRLLGDIEDGLYDGVVVVEYERLSRGDEMDAAIIKRTLRTANVKIITPQKTHDLNDEDEEVLVGVMAILARREYQRIKRRFARGKREGAKMGKWVQGKPPFPYAYDRVNKRVVVDEDKRPLYVKMRDDALAGDSMMSIAVELNRLGSRGDRGKPWDGSSVHNILLNYFHLGEIHYNKTNIKDGKVVHVDAAEWVRSVGDHERLITADQHHRIAAMVASRARIANRSKAGTFPLSGLVKCARCGRTQVTAEKHGRHVLYACSRRLPDGTICPNVGVQANIVYEEIEAAAVDALGILNDASVSVNPRKSDATAQLDTAKRELADAETRLSRLVDLATDGLVTKEQFAEKKSPIDEKVRRLKVDIARLEAKVTTTALTTDERQRYLGDITRGDFWTRRDFTDKARHAILALLIEKVVLTATVAEGRARKLGAVEVDVLFR